MNYVRKIMSALGGIFLAALLIAALAPKATRGVAAALVQVVNTPTTAIPAVQAPPASALYVHQCRATFTFGSQSATCNFPSVAAGETLFIETFSAFMEVGDTAQADTIILQDANLSPPISFNALPTFTTIDAGVAFYIGNLTGRIAMSDAAGVQPTCIVDLNAPTSFGVTICSISGYLAPGS